jgi:hypothetical protein
MDAVYLLLIMLSPTGEIVEKGYSDVTFNSLPECQKFVEVIVDNMEENIDAFSWDFNFKFRALMNDGS